MANTDDRKNARATLKLAEALRCLTALLGEALVLNEDDSETMAHIWFLVDSADKEARGVDNGALRDYEVAP